MSETMTLLIGVSGSGKTHFSMTWEKPIKFYDLEAKAQNALPGWRERVDEIITYKEEAMDGALEMTLPPQLGGEDQQGHVSGKPKMYKEFTEDLQELVAEDEEWGTIVIDSWSQLCECASRQLLSLRQRIGMPASMPEYGALYQKFRELLPFLRALPCKHLVMTAHEDVSEDEQRGTLRMTPVSEGQKIRPVIPRKFDNVWRTYTKLGSKGDAEFMVRTQPQGLFTFGKCIWEDVPAGVHQDFQSIKERYINKDKE